VRDQQTTIADQGARLARLQKHILVNVSPWPRSTGGVLLSLAATVSAKDEAPGIFGVDYLSGHAGVKHFSAELTIEDQQIRITDGHKQQPKVFTVPLAVIPTVTGAFLEHQAFVTIMGVRAQDSARLIAQVLAAAKLPTPPVPFDVVCVLPGPPTTTLLVGILTVDGEAIRIAGRKTTVWEHYVDWLDERTRHVKGADYDL
jgi:hypothetical protein